MKTTNWHVLTNFRANNSVECTFNVKYQIYWFFWYIEISLRYYTVLHVFNTVIGMHIQNIQYFGICIQKNLKIVYFDISVFFVKTYSGILVFSVYHNFVRNSIPNWYHSFYIKSFDTNQNFCYDIQWKCILDIFYLRT